MTKAGCRSRPRWLAWSLGAVALLLGVLALRGTADDPETSGSPDRQGRTHLGSIPHTVVYEVTAPKGRSPRISFRSDGINTTELVENARLPWRKKLTLTAGPAPAVAQVMATGGDSDNISCSVRVDGELVDSRTAKGPFTSVSCSGTIQPGRR